MCNYNFDNIKENDFKKIIIYNEFLKKYFCKNTSSKYNSSVFKKLIKCNYWSKCSKYLSNMYCNDLIYFSSYCLNNSGHMRFHMQYKLDQINNKILHYKI